MLPRALNTVECVVLRALSIRVAQQDRSPLKDFQIFQLIKSSPFSPADLELHQVKRACKDLAAESRIRVANVGSDGRRGRKQNSYHINKKRVIFTGPDSEVVLYLYHSDKSAVTEVDFEAEVHDHLNKLIPGERIEETRRRITECIRKRYLLTGNINGALFVKANEKLIESELEFLETIRLSPPRRKLTSAQGAAGGSGEASNT